MPSFTGCLDTCLPDSSSEPDYNFKNPSIHPTSLLVSKQSPLSALSPFHFGLPTGLYLLSSLYQIDCLCQRLESSAPPIVSLAVLF